MTWGSSKWGASTWGAGASALTAVSPTTISAAGGETITVTGTFSTITPVTVHLGPLGTSSDPLCYGGQGLGYEALSLDGITISVITPPLEKGSVSLTVVGTGAGTIGGIAVIERNWPGKLHRVRRLFTRWTAVGRRDLQEESSQ